MEVSSLNQIATFRLARSEIHRHKTTMPQTHDPSFHGGPVGNDATEHGMVILRGSGDTPYTIHQRMPQSREISNIPRNNSTADDPSNSIELSQNDLVPPNESDLSLLPLDEAEYLPGWQMKSVII
ncbi:hypothetical protein F5Y06DRAFT_144273 [Hypoxylon sp. FL0890]|nr:hypothetical protein F5Y06DRAFT_144273 [Hypoxylon sp. FL0890]